MNPKTISINELELTLIQHNMSQEKFYGLLACNVRSIEYANKSYATAFSIADTKNRM